MTRGFVTIATGRERYYVIASNLLASYRHFADEPMPFAILCSAENEYTRLFDDVVILDNPRCSYLDKLALPRFAPYDETIFIDADCLAYRDLNDFWHFFEGQADFTAFGSVYPATYPFAWFKREDAGEYSDRIEFIPDFIGGVYFIRKTAELEAFSNTCTYILEHYHDYTFRQFADPADEPVFALAMAAHGFRPVNNESIPICFYPHNTSFKSDISKGQVIYKSMYEPEARSWAYMVHWGSGNTPLHPYTTEIVKLRNARGETGALSTVFDLARIKAAHQGKNCAKTILSKLRLLDTVRDMKNSLRASSPS